MNHILILFFCFFVGFDSFAINGNADEITQLKRNLENSKSSVDEINILNKLSLTYNETNLDSALYFSHLALNKAAQINKPGFLADSYYSLGVTFRNKNIADSANFCLFNSLKLYEQLNDFKNVIKTKIAIGEYYRGAYNLRKAVLFENEAISLSQKNNFFNFLPSAYNRLGAIYFELSVNNAVIDSFYKDTVLKAISYIDSSIFWSKKLNIRAYSVSNNNILGVCYKNLKNLDLANHYLFKALYEAGENGEIIEMPMIYRNLSANFQKLKQYDKAITMALKGAKMSDSLGLSISSWQNYYSLFVINEELNDATKALFYLKKADSLQSIVFNQNTAAKAREFEAKYRTKENELLIVQQNIALEKKQKQFIYSLVWLMFSIIILIGGVFFILRIRKINKLLEIKNNEIERSSKELTKLSQFKNDLMGMIVHDLKNPLNTIINFSKISNQKENVDFEKQKDNRQNIESSAWNMLNIVNNIIDLQKFEDAKITISLTENSINNLIAEALKNVSLLLLKKNITINSGLGNTIISKCDRDLIERVLINLLTNAIKFSPINETITIAAEQFTGYVKIKITDKGPGIAPDKIPLLFNKFARAEIRSSGFSTSSGLGLAFSKLAIHAHGGEVGVNSELGKGACFWFTLKADVIDSQIENAPLNSIESDLKYSDEFLKNILPLKKTLADYQFYETSEILNAIKNFRCESSEYGQWKNEIENAVLYSNKNKYVELTGSQL